MKKHEVRTPEQALAYLTDCLLATVSSMAMLKSRKVGEYKRHISIAQTACNWLSDFDIDRSTTRADGIIGDMTVAEWAKLFEVNKGE